MELSRLKNNNYVPYLFPSPICWLVYMVLQKTDLTIWCNDSFFFLCPEEAEVWFYQQAFPLDRKLVIRLKWHEWIFLSVVVAFWLTVPYLIISKYAGIRSNQESIHLDTRSNQGWGSTVLISYKSWWAIIICTLFVWRFLLNISHWKFIIVIRISQWRTQFKLAVWKPQSFPAADKARQLFCLWLQLLFCRINLFAFNTWAQSSCSFIQRVSDYY